MTNTHGAARLRDAIEKQDGMGRQCLTLDMATAYDLLHEIEKEREQEKSYFNELIDLKLDLGMYEDGPEHYMGDGVVSGARAIRSMCVGWETAERKTPLEAVWWACGAVKYIWRYPLKGDAHTNLQKALDCVQRAIDALEVAK